jgi:hypothetical protein
MVHGTIRTKQEPVKMGAGYLQDTGYLKVHLYISGPTNNPICVRFLNKDKTIAHIPCDCEAIGYWILSPGVLLQETR